MKCPSCESECKEGAKFCTNCGAKLVAPVTKIEHNEDDEFYSIHKTTKAIQMSIADTLREYYKTREWEDEISVDEENNTASSDFSYSIEGQPFRTYFEIDEGKNWLILYMYLPNNCPEGKKPELLKLLNHINGSRVGTCLVLLQDGRVRQQYWLDVEDGVLSTQMIHKLLGTSTVFEGFYAAIMSVIFTDKTADDVIRELETE